MLQLIQLEKSFAPLPYEKQSVGKPYHYIFNAEFAAEKIHMITGPTGIGKTTLFSLISGLMPSDGGTIIWESQSISHLPAFERPLNIVFQDHNLFYHLNSKQNLELGFSKAILNHRNFQPQLLSYLERTKSTAILSLRPHQLSGGQKQLVALIRSLLRLDFIQFTGFERKILLFDEPFNGLDNQTAEWMQQLILEKIEGDKATFLYSSHDLSLAHSFSDQVWRMDLNENGTIGITHSNPKAGSGALAT